MNFGQEIEVDNFAGGGGASEGIEAATGRSVAVAVNHDPEAVAMHTANHPGAEHLCQSVWRADPRDVARGRPVGLAWFSPDCTHFSKAKGGKPVEHHRRDLAWVVVHWAQLVRPRVIILENVEEFREWGPLIEGTDGKLIPCPLRKGLTYRRWRRELVKLGYHVEERELRACDYGAPTSRKRLFVIARCDGQPIVWPAPTHGPGRAQPWATAADIIDWSLPCPSIFLTREEGRLVGVRRPLSDNTMRRIAADVKRYVFDDPDPFIVPSADGSTIPTLIQTGYGERKGQAPRVPGLHKPLGTVVGCGQRHALVAPVIVKQNFGSKPAHGVTEPLHTITTQHNKHTLVAAFLAHHNTGVVGHSTQEPLSTIVQKGCTQAVVASRLVNLKGSDRRSRSIREPAPTICGGGEHLSEVRAFLLKYYGTDQDPRLREPIDTLTTKARFGLVVVAGEVYQIADIGMRMLTPRELFRAQGFRESYIIDPMCDGSPITKTAQIRCCGNSVCPPLAEALVRANYVAGADLGVEIAAGAD